ncbi:kunitz-type serine protease inhibitor-like [Ostrea edulis]|uniref:kunitz-type serine protease inhibitor-like n=1 Tax=Ostrea edulis TaxID=37623 RepID=UPI00209659DD|nr:kunitz-type serine protease inhibitor-like [Ostrea edulis]
MELSYCIGLLITLALVVVNGTRYGEPPPPNTPDICTLPRNPGPCRGACPRYYYDARSGRCRSFTYGCCGGNANNFKTKSLCKRICQPEPCPTINCIVGACTIQTCPGVPGATCRAVCTCISVWVYDGEDVSDRCWDRTKF